MEINGNSIRPGNVVEHKGGLWRAIKIAHTQPGKGGAYLQVELKNLIDGSKLNERFRAAEKVVQVRLEQVDFQFLFADDDMYTFMDIETYDQIALSGEDVGENNVSFLQDGMKVIIEMYDEKPLGVQLPSTVILEVSETEPVIKGQTAANSNKPAVMENGVRLMVPPFISAGDRLVVNTEEGTYNKRAD